jgi:hypothetical protein
MHHIDAQSSPQTDNALAQELCLQEKEYKVWPNTIRERKRICTLEEGGANKDGFKKEDCELKALLDKEKARQKSQRYRNLKGVGEFALSVCLREC